MILFLSIFFNRSPDLELCLFWFHIGFEVRLIIFWSPNFDNLLKNREKVFFEYLVQNLSQLSVYLRMSYLRSSSRNEDVLRIYTYVYDLQNNFGNGLEIVDLFSEVASCYFCRSKFWHDSLFFFLNILERKPLSMDSSNQNFLESGYIVRTNR